MTGTDKHYLGDGLYARDDGHQVSLETFNGHQVTNAVYLDSEVLLAFFRFVERSRGVVIRIENTPPAQEGTPP